MVRALAWRASGREIVTPSGKIAMASHPELTALSPAAHPMSEAAGGHAPTRYAGTNRADGRPRAPRRSDSQAAEAAGPAHLPRGGRVGGAAQPRHGAGPVLARRVAGPG